MTPEDLVTRAALEDDFDWGRLQCADIGRLTREEFRDLLAGITEEHLHGLNASEQGTLVLQQLRHQYQASTRSAD